MIDDKIQSGKPITKSEWEYYRKNTIKKYIKDAKKIVKIK